MKKLAWVLLLTLAITSVALAGGKTNPPLTARECKMLLTPERFQDRDAGTQQFAELLTALCKKLGVKATFNTDEEESLRLISFLDTVSFDLYSKSYILRKRQNAEIKKNGTVKREDGSFELTLKYRHPDPLVAILAKVTPASDIPGKVSFEENVLIRASSIDKVYDYSAKLTQDKKPGDILQDYAKIYPGLLKIGVAPSGEIKRVNDIQVLEYSRDIGTIDLGRGVFAKASMAVWYKQGESKPLIAEFSYKYKLKAGENMNTTIYSSARRSDELVGALQQEAKDWISPGKTKTGLIFQKSDPNQD